MKIVISFPEMALPKSERRKRQRHFARKTTGINPLTPREIRRLPNGNSKHAQRQERRQMRRYARRRGTTAKELMS